MKIKLLLFALLLATIISKAQTRLDTLQKKDPYGDLSLGVSYTRHGTGDLNGYLIDIGYEFNLKKRFSFYNNIAFSINSDRDYAYDNVTKSTVNPFNDTKPLIFVTSGVQTSPTLFYAIANREKQKFKFGIGPVFRYQESSLPNGYSYSNGESLGIENYYVIFGVQPRIFTIGYKVSLDYAFLVTPRNRFSLKYFYQNDTNGDLLVGIGFSYAHKIRFF